MHGRMGMLADAGVCSKAAAGNSKQARQSFTAGFKVRAKEPAADFVEQAKSCLAGWACLRTQASEASIGAALSIHYMGRLMRRSDYFYLQRVNSKCSARAYLCIVFAIAEAPLRP